VSVRRCVMAPREKKRHSGFCVFLRIFAAKDSLWSALRGEKADASATRLRGEKADASATRPYLGDAG